MKKYLEILQRCILFDSISEENLLNMLRCIGAKVQQYKKNQTIIMEGQKATHIGIVLSGEVQIMHMDYYGNRSLVTEIYPSQLFGESFVCAEVKSIPISAIASDNSDIILIDGKRIMQSCCNACEFHNQVIFNLLKVIAIKNLIFHQKIDITSKRTTREKLMTYLLQQAKTKNSSSFTIPYDRQELADYLEVDRSGLSSEISKLRAEGILKCKRSQFTLLSP